MTDALAWSAALAVAGAIVGSFLATIVVRWPEGRGVSRGRSACDGCGRMLTAVELVPLAAALASRGRCRTCDAAIDPVHWWMEASAAIIGAVAGVVATGWTAVAGAVLGWLLLVLAVLDWRHFWLPDRLVAALALGGVAGGAAGVAPDPGDRLIGGIAGFALLWSVARGYRLLRGRDGMGAGDPKLFAAIGLWLGWRLLPAVLVVAGLVGLGIVAWRWMRGRSVAADDALPLGTLLAVAAYPAWAMMVGVGS